MALRILATFAVVAVLFAILILVGTYFGAIGLGIGFAVFMGGGIWYYNYTNNKEKCPKQK